MRWVATLAVLILLLGSQASQASAPKTFSYQGILEDNFGIPVPDGEYDFTFSLYEADAGEFALWTETQVLTVTDGIFNAVLGAETPITLPFDNPYWLGISIGVDPELAPRVELTSSPYAFNSERLDGMQAGDFSPVSHTHMIDELHDVNVSHANNGEVLTYADGTWTASEVLEGSGDITQVAAGDALSGGGDEGDVTLHVNAGAGLSIAADSLKLDAAYAEGSAFDGRFVNEGQADAVDAGMIAPDLIGSLDGVVSDAGNIDLVAGANVTITPDDIGNTITISSTGGDDGDWIVSGDDLSSGVPGNIGIGTATPAEKLDVVGTARADRFVSSVPTGTAPLEVSSTTHVQNLNADRLDDLDASDFASASHPHGAEDITSGLLAVERLPVGEGPDQVAAGNHGHALGELDDVDVAAAAEDEVLTYRAGSWTAATPAAGDITAVEAGDGLTGGGTVGDLSLSVGAGDAIDVSADEIAVLAWQLAGGGLIDDGANNLHVRTGVGLEVFSDSVRLRPQYWDGEAYDGRFVNEGQADAVDAGMIAPNLLSSLDGVVSDAGDIDLVAGANVTITPDDGANTITISSTANGDVTAVNAGLGLTGGGSAGDLTLDVGAGDGLQAQADSIDVDVRDFAGAGLVEDGFNNLDVNPGIGLEIAGELVQLNSSYRDGSAHDGRFVNEGQVDAVSADMIAPDLIGSLDGVFSDAGNIDLIAGSNINILSDDASNSITISADGGAADSDWTVAGDDMYSGVSGNVGIGTSNPSEKLDVAGTVQAEKVTVSNSQSRAGEFTSDYYLPTTHVLHAEYMHTGDVDAYAIWAQSAPTDNYGIGGHFEGGWHGVEGHVIPSGNRTYTGVDGYVFGGNGTNYGLSGHAVGSGTNYGVRSYAAGGTVNYAGYFEGDVHVVGNLSKSGGNFKIDHPLDPENKTLSHSFVESPDMMNIYNGNVTLDAGGEAWVELPDWFEPLNRDFRYQLTCIGGFAPVYVAEKIAGNRFKIAGGEEGLEVSWQVTGIRQDKWAEANRIQVEEMKPADEQGLYLNPAAYGQPETKSVDYQSRLQAREK